MEKHEMMEMLPKIKKFITDCKQRTVTREEIKAFATESKERHLLQEYIVKVLSRIVTRNKENENQKLEDKIFQFNELDLFLCMVDDYYEKKMTSLRVMILTCDSYKTYLDNEIEINNLYYFVETLKRNLFDAELNTKREYVINDKIVKPTQEQQVFVKNYLESHKVPVNELTYNIAMQRLLVGGDVESKFDRMFLSEKAIELIELEIEKEKKNEDIASV